jgi:hypothetical protein
MISVDHPINDPKLVSYHRPELVRLLPDLEMAYDCWVGLNGTGTGDVALKQKYLSQEPGEPKSAYMERLNRSTYAPTYRDAIRGYAGLLGRFELIDVPPSMESNQDNVDMQGSSIQAFYGRADQQVLRDGGVYVMVDMPPATGPDNYLDQQRDGRAPYLILVNRADVINWHVEYIRGRQRVLRATVRQYRPMPIPGSYEVAVEAVYHVLEPNKVSTYRVEKGVDGWRNILVEEMPTSVPFVPLVWYGANSTNFGVSEMPMHGLASLSLQHFQMRSDLVELLHKCAMPVPVRKGAMMGANGKPAPIVIGPNTAIEVDAEGDFKFAEPHAQSLLQHQNEIKHLEELMDRSSLNFLYGADVKTATEASLRAAQVSAQVSSMVRTKVSSFTTVMYLWALFAGETASLGAESGLAMNDSLINKPIDPSGIAQMVNLYREGLISRQTILEELRRGGVLDPDLQIEAEIQRIEEDSQRKQDQELEKMEAEAEIDQADQPSIEPSGPNRDDIGNARLAAENQVDDKMGTTSELGR